MVTPLPLTRLATVAADSAAGGGLDRLSGLRLEVGLRTERLLTFAGFVALGRSPYAARPVGARRGER